MSQTCYRTRALTEAASHGDWSEEVVRHVDECDSCAEAAFVLGVQLLKERDAGPTLIDSVVIWWKGRAASRARAIDRATSVITITQVVALAATLVGVVLVGTMTVVSSPSVRTSVTSIAPWFAVLAAIMVLVVAAALRTSRRIAAA
jgi:hypothetical protein